MSSAVALQKDGQGKQTAMADRSTQPPTVVVEHEPGGGVVVTREWPDAAIGLPATAIRRLGIDAPVVFPPPPLPQTHPMNTPHKPHLTLSRHTPQTRIFMYPVLAMWLATASI